MALHPQDTFVGLIGDAKKLFGDTSHALSAAIYTEVSDVEDELNGLITYDRQARTSHLTCSRMQAMRAAWKWC